MNSKRKLEAFDPNESDSNDENFEPAPDSSPRRSKKSRKGQFKNKPKHHRSKRQKGHYRGSDIEDDDEEDDSLESVSEGSSDEESEQSDVPLNKAGRRTRKAAAAQHNWIESSENEDDFLSEEDIEEDEDEKPELSTSKRSGTRKTTSKPSFIVTIKVSPEKLLQQLGHPRRSTCARTEEKTEASAELSESKGQSVVADGSNDDMTRSTRSTRGMKGVMPVYNESIPDSDPAGIDEETVVVETQETTDVPMADEDGADASKPAESSFTNGNANDDDANADDDDDDDDAPVVRRSRNRRNAAQEEEEAQHDEAVADDQATASQRTRRLTRRAKKGEEASSDFEPNDHESEEENSDSGKQANGADDDDDDDNNDDDDDSPPPTRRGRPSRKAKSQKSDESVDEDDLDQDELAEELHELTRDTRSSRRRRQRSPSIIYDEPAKRRRAAAKPAGSYFMAPLNTVAIEEDEADDPIPAPTRRRGGRGGANGAWERPLNSTYGPFGGATAGGALLGGPWGTGATGGVDSDSSDDEMGQRSNAAGNVGVASGSAGGLLGGVGGLDTNTPSVGKIKNHKALADADPLGIDMSVDFSKVGGLEGHIDKLKEMVQLPLLYPELFQRFHVTPPRGVLFHGPPGTGKTLLARALANSVTSGGKKISFYMRKGADALSKWVGEAEKQLRLLFEEARRTQPSIIFFDEIDGLAPVRSSKQEQIHASIVSTLLALMDGMDGRGQVIVIGATNRPDNIDPALRRPGRFDREFYFPLPDLAARRSILNIHTDGWGLSDAFKDKLAESTKGYGGADLRALCTEAALNSIQRAYPQIYGSKEKLVVDPSKINVHATDFMISIKGMIPSSERSTSSAATPLPQSIEPLLQDQLATIKSALDASFPRKKKTTALEEAMYEQHEDGDHGFGRENLHQEFERSRVFRPRLLIHGEAGMGQTYLAQALLHYLEGVHVQTFDLPALMADGRSMEQVIVSQFTEIRRHKPSVIFIPNVEVWYASVENTLAYLTFRSMLKAIPASDPVLVLATAECTKKSLPVGLIKDIFGFTQKNLISIERPSKIKRRTYFEAMTSLVFKEPTEFPNPENRRKRVLEVLPVAPPPPPREPSREEIKALLKRDRQLLNQLKVLLQPIMDQINRRYRKFRTPVIPFSQLQHLYNQMDPLFVNSDVTQEIPAEHRRYTIVKDKYGVDVLFDNETQKIYYNLETTTIEERLSNGFYARPKDFLFDIRTLAKDSRNIGDKERTLKANELVSNVEVDVASIETTSQIDWESLYQRQLARARAAEEKLRKRQAAGTEAEADAEAGAATNEDSDSVGPVTLGEQIPGLRTAARFQLIDIPNLSTPEQYLTTGIADTSVVSNGAQGAEEDTMMSGMEEPNSSVFNRSSMGPPAFSTPLKSLPLSQKPAAAPLPGNISISDFALEGSGAKSSELSQLSETPVYSSISQGNTCSTTSQGNTCSTASQDNNNTNSTGTTNSNTGTTTNINTGTDPSADSMELRHLHHGNMSEVPDTQPLQFTPNQSTTNFSGTVPGNKSLLLESPAPAGRQSSTILSQQRMVLPSRKQVDMFLGQVTERTSGCTIEQLEQIGREMMDDVWRTRGEWNRVKVLEDLTDVFNYAIGDIEETQGALLSSQVRG
ncbi:hypothetical protein TD95_005105, partial [Thielaviopsis punctulata]